MTNPLIRDAERRAAGASELDRQFKLGDQDFSCGSGGLKSEVLKAVSLLDNALDALSEVAMQAEQDDAEPRDVKQLKLSQEKIDVLASQLRALAGRLKY